ncbi:hypothetical protein VTK73DRAFT_4490 [Phialemonium thermophilum]|uniref:Secreted protein n=1 Tax=Phialemonium thermophilum TaxID=223376 RepID=A0ABR3V8C3_9PEZI
MMKVLIRQILCIGLVRKGGGGLAPPAYTPTQTTHRCDLTSLEFHRNIARSDPPYRRDHLLYSVQSPRSHLGMRRSGPSQWTCSTRCASRARAAASTSAGTRSPPRPTARTTWATASRPPSAAGSRGAT